MEIKVEFHSLTTTTHPPIINLPSSGQQVTARLSVRKVPVTGGKGSKIPWSGTLNKHLVSVCVWCSVVGHLRQ